MTTTKMSIDMNQGINKDGRKFGYVHGTVGGFFFTWMPTLEETLATIEADEVDGDGDLTEADVAEFLSEKIASNFDAE